MNAAQHDQVPAAIVGGTGYVAGELLRLVAQHPGLRLAGVSSESQAGAMVAASFPHLAPVLGELAFLSQAGLAERLAGPRVALFSAAPHVVSAALVAQLLTVAKARNCKASVVDVSADFRYPDARAFEAVYSHEHGAPALLPDFTCALPEHVAGTPTAHVGHPGCFATSMLLGIVPLLKAAIVEPWFTATGITGSTGAGRSPLPTTHHPERHANLFAYNPLQHRHAPEVTGICSRLTGVTPELNFIPHSGPFARGIHMTLQARPRKPVSREALRDIFATFYAGSPFVQVVDGAPRLKDVVGSNYAHIGVAAAAGSVAVFVVIDNLVKGAAGGAVQWMNRLLGMPETAGLTAPAAGWT